MSMFSFSAFKTPETTDLNSDEEDSELIRELDQLDEFHYEQNKYKVSFLDARGT